MATEGVATAVPPSELWALRFKFAEGSATWRLGCAAHPGPLAAGWSAAHDAGLLTALRELSELGGLPNGTARRSPASWSAAEAALRAVHSALNAAGGARLDIPAHKCAPGYETGSCKQVRLRGATHEMCTAAPSGSRRDAR